MSHDRSAPQDHDRFFSEPALALREASVRRWGANQAIEIVGRSSRLVEILGKARKIAAYDDPVLITGESGTGKESLAAALHVLGRRRERPFVSVNCPQYQEGNLTVSELFGHRKGSFTGAVSDRKGCFETAQGGVVFLDEIGDLNMSAQVMLLRTLANGEFQPLGSDTVRKADVRIVAATNRALNQLVFEQHFRNDLLFRLRHFLLELPPLRHREDDWLLLIDYCLDRLHHRHGVAKHFSPNALRLLESYPWPGNVRELIGIVTTGYALADGAIIQPRDFADRIELSGSAPAEPDLDRIGRKLQSQSGDFWTLVHQPFLDRGLSRREVRRLVARGLRDARGSYRRLLDLWRLPATEYKRFMGFLRHHRLQPDGFRDREP